MTRATGWLKKKRAQNRMQRLESMLLSIHSRTTDKAVREYIEAEFYGDADSRRFTSVLMSRSILAKTLESLEPWA